MKRLIVMVIIVLATMVVAFAELTPNAGAPAIQQEIAQQQVILRQYICRGDKAAVRRVQGEISLLNQRLVALEGKVAVHGTMLHDHEGRMISLEENRKGYLTKERADGLYQPVAPTTASNNLPASALPSLPVPAPAVITPPAAPATTGKTASNQSGPPVIPAGDPMQVINFLTTNWWWLLIIAVVLVLVLRTNIGGLLASMFDAWDNSASSGTFEARGRHVGVRWNFKVNKP